MTLTKEQLAQLVAQAREHAPYETCGLIGGKDGLAKQIYPVKNVAPDRVKRYLMDPQEQFNALSDIDKKGWDVIAIYHSHPATQAYPSQTDLNDAYDPNYDEELYPGTAYILISLAIPELAQIRAYEFIRREIREITLQVMDNELTTTTEATKRAKRAKPATRTGGKKNVKARPSLKSPKLKR